MSSFYKRMERETLDRMSMMGCGPGKFSRSVAEPDDEDLEEEMEPEINFMPRWTGYPSIYDVM